MQELGSVALHTLTVTGSIVALLYFYVRLQESSVLIYIYVYIHYIVYIYMCVYLLVHSLFHFIYLFIYWPYLSLSILGVSPELPPAWP